MPGYSLNRIISTLVLIIAVANAGAQDPSTPVPAKNSEKAKATNNAGSDKKSPAFWQIPAGAIMVLCEQAADSLKLLPKMVVLPPEKYQELLDELLKLKEQQGEIKPIPPSSVLVSGKVDASLAKLKVRFSFQTEKPGMNILLGCALGQASSAMMDGKIPLLKKSIEGFVVFVETPGAHDLDLELLVTVKNLGENQSFELDMPGAAITQLELDMPSGTINPKIISKTNQETLAFFKGNRLSATLGPLTMIQTVWKSSQRDSQPKALTSETNILVRMDDKILNARAEIKIGALGGRLDVLDLVVPLGSEVRPFSPADEARILSIEKIDQQFASNRKIKLKDSSSESLKLVVESQASIPSNGGQLPVGPYLLTGAIRQTGVILLSNQGNDLKVSNQPRGEISSQEVSAQDKQRDTNIFASFRYWNHPVHEKPGSLTGANSLSLLDLQLDLIRGVLELKTVHTVRLARKENNQWYWNITTSFDCTPVRTGSDKVEIRIPAGMIYDETKGPIPANIIRDVAMDVKAGKLVVQFAQELLNPFQFSLDFHEAFTPEETSRISLPFPMQVRDRGGQISLVTPDDFHLLTSEKLNTSFELLSHETHKQVWKSEKFSQKIDAILKAADDKTQVRQTLDVQFNGANSLCKQQMHLQFLGRIPTMVQFNVPKEIADNLRILKGGRIEGIDNETGILSVALAVANKETDLEFDYEYSINTEATSLQIPFLTLLNSKQETVIQIWAKPGVVISTKNNQWKEHPLEAVAKIIRLPNASFRSEKPSSSLDIDLSYGLGVVPMVEKILARAKLDRTQIAYRVSYYYKNSTDQVLDFSMPANFQDAKLTINHLICNWQYVTQGKNITRVALPKNIADKPFILEWEFTTPRPQGILSSFHNALAIPLLNNHEHSVNWWIKIPSNRVALLPEPNYETAKQWHWSNFFLSLDTIIAPGEYEGITNADINDADSILASSDLLISNSSQSALTLFHLSKTGLQLIFSLMVFSVLLLCLYITKIKTWMVPNMPWIAFFIVVMSSVFYALFPMLTARIFLGVQPALYALLIGGSLIQLRKLLSAYQAANLASFSRTKGALSTIQPNYKKPQFGNSQQSIPKDNNEATGYWVRPDPSMPSKSTSNMPASKAPLVQDVLPD